MSSLQSETWSMSLNAQDIQGKIHDQLATSNNSTQAVLATAWESMMPMMMLQMQQQMQQPMQQQIQSSELMQQLFMMINWGTAEQQGGS